MTAGSNVTTTLKPIETHYAGCRFRSRLEARWAVFFDSLGVEWQYEPEGYVLPDGTRYLPDFLLTAEATFIEIKPPDPNATCEDMVGWLAKCSGLAEVTGSRVLLIAGEPYSGKYHCVLRPSCGGWGVCTLAEDRRNRGELWLRSDNAGFDCACALADGPEDHGRYPVIDSPAMLKAYTAARSARFEFGESGAPGIPNTKRVPAKPQRPEPLRMALVRIWTCRCSACPLDECLFGPGNDRHQTKEMTRDLYLGPHHSVCPGLPNWDRPASVTDGQSGPKHMRRWFEEPAVAYLHRWRKDGNSHHIKHRGCWVDAYEVQVPIHD